MEITLVGVVTVVAVVMLLLLLLLPKKIHYFLSGVVLLALGTLPVLFDYGFISFDYRQFPVLDFVTYFIVVIAGKDLFKEGIEEDTKNILKYPSIVLGLVLIAYISVPKLYKLKAIPWTFPEQMYFVEIGLLLISGIILIIGAVTILGKK